MKLNTELAVNNQKISQNVKMLAEGSSVSVVITGQKQDGRYEGSVAGVKVNISSGKVFQKGSEFVATVTLQNGKIHLIPENANVKIENIVLVENAKITQILNGLGLPENEITKNILLQLKQLGLPLDSDSITKIYNILAKTKGKKKNLASLMVILEQKGIKLTETQIAELLDELDFETDSENKNDFENKITEDKKINLENEISGELKKYISDVFKILPETEDERSGILTLLNHIQKKDGNGNNWIFLPFEICSLEKEKLNEKTDGKGLFAFLMDENLKLKKMNIGYKELNGGSESNFSVNFEEGRAKEIYFNISGKEKNSEKMIAELKKKFNDTEVFWAEKEKIEFTAAGNEKFFSAGGYF